VTDGLGQSIRLWDRIAVISWRPHRLHRLNSHCVSTTAVERHSFYNTGSTTSVNVFWIWTFTGTKRDRNSARLTDWTTSIGDFVIVLQQCSSYLLCSCIGVNDHIRLYQRTSLDLSTNYSLIPGSAIPGSNSLYSFLESGGLVSTTECFLTQPKDS